MKRNVKTNTISRRDRIAIWVIAALAVGFIAYGAWLGQNMSIG